MKHTHFHMPLSSLFHHLSISTFISIFISISVLSHHIIYFYIYFLNIKYPIVNDSSKIFPINYLRDVAFKNVRSELVMFIEGDYVVNKEFKSKLVSRM